jgi:3-oxoacyl-[acyl-carrier protein] reductase
MQVRADLAMRAAYLRGVIIHLHGKTALVCGSTQGIGKAIAHQLAAAGATCILLARNEARLQEVCSALPAEDGQHHRYYVADFSEPASVLAAATRIAEDGGADILVNNTGGPPAGPIATAGTDAFLDAFRLHLLNNHQLVQAVLPGMKAKGQGRIINIISTSVKVPLHNLGVSNTIRAAVGNWSKTLANETAASGITVNNVLPGATKTERLSSIISGKAAKTGASEESVRDEMLAEIPAGRFGTPEEVAHAVVFLASPQAAYITGTNIVVDGGRTPNL